MNKLFKKYKSKLINKIPPHSVEAEQSVIGSLLLDNSSLDNIMDMISPSDFYKKNHQIIFEHILRLITSSYPADVITVYEMLILSNKSEYIGGLSYLHKIAQNTPNSVNIKSYAEIVKNRSMLRKIISVSNEISNNAFNTKGKRIEEILSEAESKISSLYEGNFKKKKNFIELNELLYETIGDIDYLYREKNKNEVTGISTGFTELDKMTSGMHAGELIIVAGRPSMGKTSFSMNIGEHVAMKHGLPVIIFSMEMPGKQLIMRMIGSIAKLNQHRIKTGRLMPGDWQKITEAIKKISNSKIFIDESGTLNPNELRSRAKRLFRQNGKLGIIVIDYLQLMNSNIFRENRTTEISEISRSLKRLAKELNVPVIALSQLNRSLEQRQNRRPIMSDLRESGAIEQDADLILFIYRDEIYNPNSTDKGIAEIIIGKQRNGPIGNVKLSFLGHYTKFDNLKNINIIK